MLFIIDTLTEFTALTVVCSLIPVLALALLIAFERERQRRAKHRASTQRLLHQIEWLPRSAGLERNARATWVG